jgi:hypothetical protein
MSTDSSEKSTTSLWERFVGHRRRPWIALVAGILLAGAPLVAAYADGALDELLSQGTWRLILTPAAVVVYIMAVAPVVERAERAAIDAFRPLVPIDDLAFDRLVDESSRLSPIGEGIALSLGTIFGLWMGQAWVSESDLFWMRLVLIPSAGLMFGLLAWTIYGAVAGTRLINELHRQPLRFDIFDTKPFRPIGRQSLIIALVFVGGIVLGMVFGLGREGILDWRNWILFILLALVPVLVFFLNMRPTHRVLAAEKNREMDAVQRNILRACRTLQARVEEAEHTGTLGADTIALVAYEERLQATSTWPYDTAMLRTLFFSVIIPGGAALARVVGELLFD